MYQMIKIALLGDVAFFGKHCVNNNPNVYSYFDSVKQELSKFDYVVANLETPFRSKKAKKSGSKSAHIGADVENIDLLKYLGVNIVNLSNNHIFDYGVDAFDETLRVLEEHNILYFGVHGQPDLIIQKDNTKIYFNGYCCYSTNPMGLGKNGINEYNFSEVKRQLELNYSKGINTVFSVHAGQEHVNFPNYDHLFLARELSKFAPYVYYGHHPHVLQGVEVYNNSVLAHSLGNFCFDDVYTELSNEPLIKQTDNNKSSVILGLEYNDNILQNHFTIPIYLGENEMVIGTEIISEDLKKFTDFLTTKKEDYINFRNGLFTNYVLERKKLRNLKWYLKRLRWKSVMMILNSKSNRKKYYVNVKQFVK